MPRATRNTKTNSGTEVSAPANPNTWLKNSEDMPSAAPNDSTTVTMSTSGATIARSSRPEDEQHHAEDQRNEHVPVMSRGRSPRPC